mgnify:FL=1
MLVMIYSHKKQKGWCIIEEAMRQRSRQLADKLMELDAKISKLPQGSIQVGHSGRYVRWYLLKDGERTYIPRENRSFAQMMAQKKYLEYLRRDIQFEKKCIDSYLTKSETYSKRIPKLLNEHNFIELLENTIETLSVELAEWSNSPFEHNRYKTENLVHQTLSGQLVRSKSESIIASELFLNNIPFRYECILNLGDKIVFPDFTIRHPVTGQFFYWEHFGMMDNSDYADNTIDKLKSYVAHGIIPSVNLIITYETSNHPITQLKIANVVKEYFLME